MIKKSYFDSSCFKSRYVPLLEYRSLKKHLICVGTKALWNILVIPVKAPHQLLDVGLHAFLQRPREV